MKKPMVGLTLGLFALLFMLSSAAWAVSANEHYQVGEDVQSNQSQITQGNLLPSNEGNKQTLYTPLNGNVADGQWVDFVDAWQLAADQGGAVTLQQDVLVAAADAPEGIFVQVPEDGQVLLNLNGHRLVGEEVPCLIYVGARGKLTVTDGGQSGSQIVGVVYPDDSADDENEWGQFELVGDVEVVDPNVMMLADDEAEYTPNNGGQLETGTFKDMWNKAAVNGGTVKLLKNITADSNSSFGYGDGFVASTCILVPENQTITLDLNKCLLQNNKTYAILVEGTLNVLNGSDTYVKAEQTIGGIVSCNSANDGGGIYVTGTGELNWFGGRIYMNDSKKNGGAVYLEAGAHFEMSQGFINGCAATENGGAVYVNSGATFSIGGQVEIKGNTYSPDFSKNSNVYLAAGQKININSALDNDVEIWVTTENKPTAGKPVLIASRTVGSSVPAFTNANNFKSDDEQYETFVWNGDIGLKVKGDVIADPQAEYKQHENDEPVSGTFEEMWRKAATDGGIVKLLEDVTAVNGKFFLDDSYHPGFANDGHIQILVGITATLDLNGHTINRAMSNSYDNYRKIGGEVIEVNGTLTITDTSEAQNGVITGGYGWLGGGVSVKISEPNQTPKLIMEAGTISGNFTGGSGAGVYLGPNTTFTMTGGKIERNTNDTTVSGGGVYIDPQATFNVSGNVSIINNKSLNGSSESANNACLGYNSSDKKAAIVNINNSLNSDSQIGLSFDSSIPDYNILVKADDASYLTTEPFTIDNYTTEEYHLEIENGNIVLKSGAAPHEHALNYGCDSTITAGAEDVTFEKCPITDTTTSLGQNGTVHSYYLDKDIQISNTININGTVNLCLNGHVISPKPGSSNIRVFNVKQGATFNICDCNPENPNYISKENVTLSGGVITGGNAESGAGIFVENGTSAEQTTKLNLYGGSIAYNTAQANSEGKGAGVYMLNNSKFCMYGGAIKNNSTAYKTSQMTSYGGGVCLYSTDAEFNMSGGTISDNMVIGSNYSADNAMNFTGLGGGVFVKAGNTVRISGNAQIVNNVGQGGGIYMAGTMYIEGNPQIYNNTYGYRNHQGPTNNVYLADGHMINITGNLGENAKIGITPQKSLNNGRVKIVDNARSYTVQPDSFFSDSGYNVIISGEEVFLSDEHKHKLNVNCEPDVTDGNTELDFVKKLTSNDSNQLCIDGKPVTAENVSVEPPQGNGKQVNGYKLDGGNSANTAVNYYVQSDMEIDKPIIISSNVNICLNGHVIKNTGNSSVFIVARSGVLSICDCQSETQHSELTGELKGITGGLITGGKSNVNYGYGHGGGIYNYQTLNIYSGTIAGNSASSYGGGIYSVNTLNMYGGTVSNNESVSGGGIYVYKGGAKISHVTVANNKANNGGGLHLTGNSSSSNGSIISDCTITGNTAVAGNNLMGSGGGIYASYGVDSKDEYVTIANCKVTNNSAAGEGGGIYTYGLSGNDKLIVSGSTNISQNKAVEQTNNIYLNVYRSMPICITAENLSSGASLGVTTRTAPTAENPIAITNAVDSSYADYFFADDSEHYHIAWNETDQMLYLTDGATPTHTHDKITYSPLGSFDSPLAAGNYYLTGNITLDDTVEISDDVNICLNGKTITGPTGKPAFKVPSGSILNIYNDEGTDDFAGLAGSGGIEVAGGGKLNMIAKDPANSVTYAPAAGSQGGKVTVDNSGAVAKPDEGGEDPKPGTGDHKVDHPDPNGEFKVINEANFKTVTQAYSSSFQGTLPDNKEAYRYLTQGKYYLEGNFTMPNALVVLNETDFCLNGSNLGADNDKWIYEMQHVFWVPEKAVLNVLDCQRNLHVVWLYGGRVFLKNGGSVNMTDKNGWQTIIESTDPEGGFVEVKQDNGNTIMTLPPNTILEQKDQDDNLIQTIKNDNGVLEMTTSEDSAPTRITPPSTDSSINLKLPETVEGKEVPDIVLEAPADSIVQTEDGPKIKLEQPGEVAADGTVSSQEVTVTTVDPETNEEVKTTITAPKGENVQVNTDGEAEVPAESIVKVDDVVVKIDKVGGDETEKTATVSPSGEVKLPPDSQVTVSNPKKDDVSIVIALPGNKEEGTLNVTDKGITPPKGSNVTVKKKEDVTIVIALPNLEGDEQPSIDFGNGGTLILPPGTKVTVDGKETEVTEDNPVFNPDTGELTDKEPENPDKPTEPVHPNEPTGKTEELKPNEPVSTENGTEIKRNDDDTITITPADETKPPITITPQPPTDPDNPGETPKPPVVDETGKVFIDEPFKVETEDGPDITAEKGGSVDPDGNVTGEKVTVEQKNPDGTTENKTTLTAPEGDAVKVTPDGEAQAPVGTEVKQDDVTVKIDKVPDPSKPVPVKPDGSIDLPGGSEITVTPENPQQPEQKYTVTVPEQGGEVKINQDNKTIILPPGAKVIDKDGKETTISNNGGTLNPNTGEIIGGLPNGGNSGGSGGGGSSSASYVITASASIGGEISPDKRVVVSRGADQTFTIKPNEGYVLSDVLVDSKSVGPVTSYTFENVRAGHTIQALFVAEGMAGHGHQGDCPKNETCPIWPYTDSIPTAWYHDGVHYCIENSLMIGTAPKEWETNIPLSRAMMAQVLYNKAGRPAVSGDGVFDDVDQEWYWPAITWGGRNDVLWGYGDGNYGPQDPITREQLATLLWRYAGQPQISSQLSFSDAAEVSDYAKQALSWASQHGVITGYPDGTFRPQDNTSRAEAAQMIMRYFNL